MNVYRVLHTLSVYPSFRPMKMPEILIICLFILYKPQTVLYLLALYEIKLHSTWLYCVRAVKLG